ncbi:hypothetical protein ACTFIW_008063 [Dictyostelium discoideum]
MSRLFNNFLLKTNKNQFIQSFSTKSQIKSNIFNNLIKNEKISLPPPPFLSLSPSTSSPLSMNNIFNKNNKNLYTINNFNYNKLQFTTQSPNSTPTPTPNNNENNENNNNNNNKKNHNNNNFKEEQKKILQEKNKAIGLYVLITIIGILGLSYAAVPLYRIFCRATGYGGTTRDADDFDVIKKRDLDRTVYPIKVTFSASTANKIPWTFKPTQSLIECLPGEPVLCFYRATNNTDKPIIGVATYNITPMKAGAYFTKIQCFCFDEQRINAHETIDMPVLFVIEPELLDDKNMKGVSDITLSYTFFKSNDQGEYEEI